MLDELMQWMPGEGGLGRCLVAMVRWGAQWRSRWRRWRRWQMAGTVAGRQCCGCRRQWWPEWFWRGDGVSHQQWSRVVPAGSGNGSTLLLMCNGGAGVTVVQVVGRVVPVVQVARWESGRPAATVVAEGRRTAGGESGARGNGFSGGAMCGFRW